MKMNMSFITTIPEDDYQSKSMKRLQDSIFRVASSKIQHPLSLETTLRINVLLGEIFSMNHDLDHPPYAEMICKAIEELHEDGGSNEASISSYIKSQFHDLPWAHESLLSSKQQIISSPSGFYKSPLSNPKPNSKKNQQLPQKENDKSLVLHNEDDHVGVENFQMKVQDPETKLTKQRGRPLKPKPEETMGSDSEEDQKQMMKEVIIKKRPGRPSKKVKEDTVLVEKKVIYGPKKRRGRPPRPKLEAALVCAGVRDPAAAALSQPCDPGGCGQDKQLWSM